VDLAAFILAGGKSTRMGQDKAFLSLGGKTLLERAMDAAREVTPEVWIVGDIAKFIPFGNVVEDRYRERGPLAGIHTALACTTKDFNLVLAVDTPFVQGGLLAHLVTIAFETGATVTLPRALDGWQPLCAVYRRAFREVAEAALRQGQNKIDPLFAQVKTRAVDQLELERLGFSGDMFCNLNTPEEWERAASEMGGRHLGRKSATGHDKA
jgi:molybdenum cofactor guanylyltransferase